MNDQNNRLLQAADTFRNRNYQTASDLLREELNDREPDAQLLWWLALAQFALSIVVPTANDEAGLEAIMFIKRAIQVRPDVARYHYFLGNMYEHVVCPDYVNAASAYRKALELEPCFYPALVALAGLYGVPEDVISLEEATGFCEKALSIAPTRSLWNDLVRFCERAGYPTHALNAQLNSMFEMYELDAVKY